jgi:hypothetical protein
MNGWKLKQFKKIVETFLGNCDSDMEEALEERLDLLSDKGNMCGMPVSEPLRDGLFSLRAKENRRQVRLIYYFKPNKIIIFVHAFYKTTRNILPRDIEKAKKNKKFIEEEGGKVNEITFTN